MHWALDTKLKFSVFCILNAQDDFPHSMIFPTEQEGTIPPWVFDLPNNGRQPNDDELDVDPRSGSTPDFSEVISPPNQSQDQVSSTDVTIIAVATACVVLVLLAIVAVLLYKVSRRSFSSII